MRTILRRANRLLFHIPFEILRERKSIKLRGRLLEQAQILPPIADEATDLDVEIHMLCGRREIDMGIFSSWSLLRFLPGVPVYLHSDGTLTQEDLVGWTTVIPKLHFIERSAADSVLAKAVGENYPLLWESRLASPPCLKLCDPHLFGDARKILLVDTDVLCFQRPAELIQCIKNGPKYVWNEDTRSAYSHDPDQLSRHLGLKLPVRLNCGFYVQPRFTESCFGFMENCLSTLRSAGLLDVKHFWYEQTVQAIWAARDATARALSKPYSCVLGRTPVDAVIRHYTGTRLTRPRYFTEGVPRILSQLQG